MKLGKIIYISLSISPDVEVWYPYGTILQIIYSTHKCPQ